MLFYRAQSTGECGALFDTHILVQMTIMSRQSLQYYLQLSGTPASIESTRTVLAVSSFFFLQVVLLTKLRTW